MALLKNLLLVLLASLFIKLLRFVILSLDKAQDFDYARTKSPTRKVLEDAIAQLESGDAGFACSSGMAALQTIFAYFSQGDHLIVSLDLYGGTYRLLERIMSRFGVTATYVDTNDLDALEGRIPTEYERACH